MIMWPLLPISKSKLACLLEWPKIIPIIKHNYVNIDSKYIQCTLEKVFLPLLETYAISSPKKGQSFIQMLLPFIQRSSNSFIVHLHHTRCKVQTQDKFPTNVNGGHFISANNTLRNEHGSQAYDLGVGGILHLHLGVRFLVLLNKISVRTLSLS